ncbi:hypothetical protein DDZ14_15280 [Maritimibacter sp. 55A14]|nr:hypothetical protein DDZ14_15280 [Maritimibacter sp. 55A14]
MVSRVEDQLSRQLGVSGGSLKAKLRRAGRRLPRSVRKAGVYLVETEARIAHPKHEHEIDDAGVAAAYETISTYLKGIDPKAERWGRFMGWLRNLAINLLIAAAALVAIAWWRGLI